MARKLPALERVLGAPALFSVAYGEVASSIYVALGIVAAKALGLTPLVLVAVGILFLVISLSYAEGTAAIPETGGAATFARKAFNDLAGFMTGWVLFLDYLIVMALSALFLPHYLAGAFQIGALDREPWDEIVAVCAIAGVGLVRLVRRPGFYTIGFSGRDVAGNFGDVTDDRPYEIARDRTPPSILSVRYAGGKLRWKLKDGGTPWVSVAIKVGKKTTTLRRRPLAGSARLKKAPSLVTFRDSSGNRVRWFRIVLPSR